MASHPLSSLPQSLSTLCLYEFTASVYWCQNSAPEHWCQMASQRQSFGWSRKEKQKGLQGVNALSTEWPNLGDLVRSFTAMKTDLSPSCGHCWVFQICWPTECSTFIASSFRIWNSSTGIPSPLLALFVVMLPKAYLTSRSRMSGSRWVITASWLSGSWRSFLYSSFVYSCHLFLISSASVRSMPFLSFIEPNFAWNVPLVSLILNVSRYYFYYCYL